MGVFVKIINTFHALLKNKRGKGKFKFQADAPMRPSFYL